MRTAYQSLKKMRLRNLRDKAENHEAWEHLPAYDEERLGKLFDALDKDENGRINAKDVLEVFSHVPEEHIKVWQMLLSIVLEVCFYSA